MTRRASTLTVASLLLVALVAAAFLLPVPYVTFEPGTPINTLGTIGNKQLITFGSGVKTYPTSGQLDLTTVSITRPDSKVGLVQAVSAWFSPTAAVIPRDLVYPPSESAAQAVHQSAVQMQGSQQTSSVAGLRAAGFAVHPYVEIVEVTPGGGAAGKLKKGDHIVAVDGTPVSTAGPLIKAIQGKKPGDTVTLVVTRNGKRMTFVITTQPDPNDKSRPLIGVQLAQQYRLPFQVRNNLGPNIGGPSAGTMFALAIYDKLTPGALTGGNVVAGTGEITDSGQVQPIGGIAQKIVGAQRAGVTIFLAPKANCAEALGADVNFSKIKLVKITTLQDAISSLKALAANPDAKVPSCR
ncbi:MAG: YlbL family protein [Nocardioidaceae bacterium]